MTRKRTSPIWKISKEELQKLLDSSPSIGNVLSAVGLDPNSGNHRTLHNRIQVEGLSLETLAKNRTSVRKNARYQKATPLSELLRPASKASSCKVKKRLLKENLLENKCSMCGIGPEWNERVLVLQLDHINGDSTDNRIENLRIVCPNCHTQTDTYAGRSNKRNIVKKCESCSSPISQTARLCMRCAGITKTKPKITWPTPEIIQGMIKKMGYRQAARTLGVSHTAMYNYINKANESV